MALICLRPDKQPGMFLSLRHEKFKSLNSNEIGRCIGNGGGKIVPHIITYVYAKKFPEMCCCLCIVYGLVVFSCIRPFKYSFSIHSTMHS